MLVQYISQIEKQIGKLRGKYDECQQSEVLLDDLVQKKGWTKGALLLVDAKVFKRLDAHRLLCQGVGKFFNNASSLYTVLHTKIEVLEEQNTNGDGQKLKDLISQNDTVFEQLMDHIARAEELVELIRVNAERGSMDQANEHYDLINRQLQESSTTAKLLSDSIQEATMLMIVLKCKLLYRCLHYLVIIVSNVVCVAKSSSMDVDFSEVESNTQHIVQLINEGLAKATESADLKTELVNDLPTIEAELADSQPREAAGSSVTVDASSPAADAVEESATDRKMAALDAVAKAIQKRTSVTLSIDELNEITEKKVAPLLLSKQTPPSAPVSKALPEGWKELFDAKSNRPYYVHKYVSALMMIGDPVVIDFACWLQGAAA
jgi:hypothetical protein